MKMIFTNHWFTVLQCDAVWCSELHCSAVWGIVVQVVAVCFVVVACEHDFHEPWTCNVLQCVAHGCSMLLYVVICLHVPCR